MTERRSKFELMWAAIMLSLVFFAIQSRADEPVDHAVVVEFTPEMSARFQSIGSTFSTQGAEAVAQLISASIKDPEILKDWQDYVADGKIKVIEVKVHPDEAHAVEWMNTRFKDMGIPNLSIKPEFDENLVNPTVMDKTKVRGREWIRYVAGAGVAGVAGFFGLHHAANLPANDMFYLLLPTIGVGLTSVALEIQFAHPKLNNMWSKVWRFGGPYFGRVTNTFVNFAYGMMLYGAKIGSAYLPTLWGHAPVPVEVVDLQTQMLNAAWDGLKFHFKMGQIQIDASTAVKRGEITDERRFSIETGGVIVNNGARVAGIAVPEYKTQFEMAQWAYFAVQTLPMAIKVHVSEPIADREVARAIAPQSAPKRTFIEKCVLQLQKIPLIPSPILSKKF